MKPGRPTRRSAWLAWSLAVVCLGLLGWLVVLSRSNHVSSTTFLSDQSFTLVFGVVFPIVGALVASRHPRNAVGWLMIVAPLFAVIQASAHAYAHHALVVSPGSLPGGGLATWVDAWSWIPIVSSVPVLFLLLPDGRPPSRQWRWVLYAAAGQFMLSMIGLMATWPYRGSVLLGGPDKLPTTPALTSLAFATFPVFFAVVLASAAAIIVRFVRSRGEERQQLKWITYAVVILVAEFVATTVRELPPLVEALTILPLAAALGIAILKYRLYDIDLVINKTLVYGSMAGFITAVYVAVVVGIGDVVGSDRSIVLSILATALVAVAFQPVRERVQRFANRLVYGERATPYEVLSEFSGGMAQTVATEELLPRMGRIVAEGTGAIEVDVWLNMGAELVREATWPPSNGSASPMVASLHADDISIEGSDAAVPVRHEGELLGVIGVKKSPGEAMKPAETKLLEDLASQAGLVLRNVRLIEELRTSRQRLVSAQDEERRRLERDLRDGAQQRLVAISLGLRMARDMVRPDSKPDLGSRIDQASEQLGLALAELREFARGIHPAILTERGLIPALNSLAERSTVPATVEANVPDRLPGAVEAAAYFVVSEALANGGKYSNATRIDIRADAIDGLLILEIADDGIGGADPSRGSGLRGLMDRVAAIDGTLEVDSPPGEGTRLHIRIPLPAMAEATP